MASITVINNNESGAVVRAAINNNFANLNTALAVTGDTEIEVSTADTTVTTCGEIVLENNTVYRIEAVILARDQAGVERAFFEQTSFFYRQGGGIATKQGSDILSGNSKTNAAIEAVMEVSGNNVRIRVTGLAATDMNWKTVYNIMKVS